MKKITLSLLVLAMSTQAHAETSWTDKLVDYGVPCLVSFIGGSMAKGSETQMAISLTGCLGIGAATYLNQRHDSKSINEADMTRIQGLVDESVSTKSAEQQKVMEVRLDSIENAQKTHLEEMRAIVREVLAERLVKLEENVKLEVSKKLESGEFMPKLEQNLNDAMKREVMIRVTESQRGIVEKCVEKTIQEVTAQPIGVRENQDGVQQ